MDRHEIEGLAKHWVNTHVPIFSVAESYGVTAFMAGYEAAMNEKKENDADRERSEDV